MIWWIRSYDHNTNESAANREDEEIEVLKDSSPWPQRNNGCFQNLNVFMERCNDILELVQTMRHFQILSHTVSIGGADDNSMNTLAQEVHLKYENALNEFKKNVSDLMNTSYQNENFGSSFFFLRNTIKVCNYFTEKFLFSNTVNIFLRNWKENFHLLSRKAFKIAQQLVRN